MFALLLVLSAGLAAQEPTIVFIKYKNFQVPITVWGDQVPEIPTGFYGVASSSNSVTLNWNHMPGAFYYELDWFNDDGFGWMLASSAASNTATVEGLLFGPNKFRVKSCRSQVGCSFVSHTVIVTLGPGGSITFSTAPSEFQNPDEVINAPVTVNSLVAVCLDSAYSVANCPANQLDSDNDGVADVSDAYPLQSNTQCVP